MEKEQNEAMEVIDLTSDNEGGNFINMSLSKNRELHFFHNTVEVELYYSNQFRIEVKYIFFLFF